MRFDQTEHRLLECGSPMETGNLSTKPYGYADARERNDAINYDFSSTIPVRNLWACYDNPIHWFVIQCGDSELTVHKWNSTAAYAPGARHFCGEAHAEVYICRWFDSVCSPPKPDFIRQTGTMS